MCWLFDLELAIIGSCYLLLALSRHPDRAGDTCFFSASRSVSAWMLSALFRVGRGVPGLPFEPGPTMPTRIPGPTRPTRINLNLSIRSTANPLNPALLCYKNGNWCEFGPAARAYGERISIISSAFLGWAGNCSLRQNCSIAFYSF